MTLLFILDTSKFHGLLIYHIFNALQGKDRNEKKWVVNEAMNVRNLQYGGTFRNSLSRKVDEIIIPVFSEIIGVIDQNYNLDLVNPKTSDPAVIQLWLRIFRESGLMQFNYTDIREQVPGVGSKMSDDSYYYRCGFPFSWLIHDAVNSQWENALSSAGMYNS